MLNLSKGGDKSGGKNWDRTTQNFIVLSKIRQKN